MPVIVLTGCAEPAIRERMMAKNIIDYVVSLLEKYFFHTLAAGNGKEAMAVVQEHPDLTLVISAINMPVIDGFQLITALRQCYRREDLAIISASDSNQHDVCAKLLKLGGNDFIVKALVVEAFYYRVTQNTTMVDYVRQSRDCAIRDFLTGVYDRRYLFEVAATLYANARRGNVQLAALLIDADHFKSVNDTYGLAAGDAELQVPAHRITCELSTSDIVARYGGGEFCAPGCAQGQPCSCYRLPTPAQRRVRTGHRLRRSESSHHHHHQHWRFETLGECFADMLRNADSGVYQAKAEGHNRYVLV